MLPSATIFALLIVGGVMVWIAVGLRHALGQPVVPWEPRRPVPWQGFHVLTLVFLYAGLQISIPSLLAHPVRPAAGAQKADDADKTDAEHLVGRLLRDSHRPSVVLICLASAGLAAPLAEEFLFRLVLQGWLEKKDRLLRRRRWGLRWLTPGVIPVTLVAMLFAGIHFRTATPSIEVSVGLRLLAGTALANLVLLIAGVAWLRLDVHATLSDLGFVPQRLAADVRTGLAAYLAIGAVLFPLQAVLSVLLPRNIAPDPFTLFPFALLVGFLYYRTHRLVPSIVVHMGLNFTSLLVAWLTATFSR